MYYKSLLGPSNSEFKICYKSLLGPSNSEFKICYKSLLGPSNFTASPGRGCQEMESDRSSARNALLDGAPAPRPLSAGVPWAPLRGRMLWYLRPIWAAFSAKGGESTRRMLCSIGGTKGPTTTENPSILSEPGVQVSIFVGLLSKPRRTGPVANC